MHSYYFKKPEIGQNVQLFVREVYQASSTFPETERLGLNNQIRRAIISISLNIAEGFSGKGRKDKAHFINPAYSTTCEAIACLILARDVDFLSEEA